MISVTSRNIRGIYTEAIVEGITREHIKDVKINNYHHFNVRTSNIKNDSDKVRIVKEGPGVPYKIYVSYIKWYSGNIHNDIKKLEDCYVKCFELAKKYGITTISFPNSGIMYECPIEIEAQVAIEVAKRYKSDFNKIYFASTSSHDINYIYEGVYKNITENELIDQYTENELIDMYFDTLDKTKDYDLALKDLKVIDKRILEPSTPANFENITVLKCTSFEAAEKFKHSKVCVLCASHPYRHGGHVQFGREGQEEDICRTSSLYHSISYSFMRENFYKANGRYFTTLYTDNFYHVPHVKVIKDYYGDLLDEPFECGVIGICAPNLGLGLIGGKENLNAYELEELEKLLIRRYSSVIKYMENEGYEVAILGPIGTGINNNPQKIVASAFKKILKTCGGKLNKIIFATSYSSNPDYYQIYRQEFVNNELIPIEIVKNI